MSLKACVAGLAILVTVSAIALRVFQGAAQNMSTEPIEIELLAEPRELSMSERSAFDVGIRATNRGTTSIDPGLDRARLLINDQDSLQWADAISNGHREEKWFELPPGDSVSMSWSSMGDVFFPHPGVYTLKLRLRDTESTPVDVRVDP